MRKENRVVVICTQRGGYKARLLSMNQIDRLTLEHDFEGEGVVDGAVSGITRTTRNARRCRG